MLNSIPTHYLKEHIDRWIREDVPFGDISTDSLFNDKDTISGSLIAKEKGLLCGLDIFAYIFKHLNSATTFTTDFKDGDEVCEGQIIGVLSGSTKTILTGERLALNLLQRLSGIATQSFAFAKELTPYATKIVDTRKTTPGLRSLEKYAVRVGGCSNHRYCLSDAVMLKDNHIKAVGSIKEAIKHVKACVPHTMKIEVEVDTLIDFEEALDSGADIIMLDNMSLSDMKCAVELNKGQTIIEASGNMTLERIQSVAETGVDIISVGALTHSVKAMDISLKF